MKSSESQAEKAMPSRALVSIEKLLQKIGQLVVENEALREIITKQNADKKEVAE